MLALLMLMLTIPGLAFAYAVLLRPVLHRIPKLKVFYDQADGFWAKGGQELTIHWMEKTE